MRTQTKMDMRVLVPIVLLIGGPACTTTAGTGASPDAVPAHIQALLGRWESLDATVWRVEEGQENRALGSFREGLAYVFNANGTYDGCLLPGSDWDNAGATGPVGTWYCTDDQSGSWQLENETLVSGLLGAGTTIHLQNPNGSIDYEFVGMTSSDLILNTPLRTDVGGDSSYMTLQLTK